jgi:hypothetical protein
MNGATKLAADLITRVIRSLLFDRKLPHGRSLGVTVSVITVRSGS